MTEAEEIRQLRELLAEFRDAEWMVSHDWGGDRAALLAKVDAMLGRDKPDVLAEIMQKAARRQQAELEGKR